jgi:AcrR family transcriptional regulator
MPEPRPYSSPKRAAAAAAKRQHVIAEATRLLAQSGHNALSLEAVAKAAGITRPTVYHQFGSRCRLLEAAFDELALRGGLLRVAEAMSCPDPEGAIDRLVEIFCGFWGSDPAIGQLYASGAADPEFASTLSERNERRRKAISVLVGRMTQAPGANDATVTDLIDVLFALTSYAMFSALLVHGRSAADVTKIIRNCCAGAVRDAVKGEI